MSWFQLDSKEIAERAQAASGRADVPSVGMSLCRGIVGFTLVSIAGFAPWALAGRWFQRTVGEAGLYAVCAVAFIGLSGPFLHRLIIGPGSLTRFYKLFGIAFAAYSAAWIGGWMTVRGHAGGVVGLLAGTALMGWIFASAFEARRQLVKVIAALFILNALGYFVGGWIEGWLSGASGASLFGTAVAKSTRLTAAKLSWGVSYGIGLGAGLGLAFHYCQTSARALLRNE